MSASSRTFRRAVLCHRREETIMTPEEEASISVFVTLVKAT